MDAAPPPSLIPILLALLALFALVAVAWLGLRLRDSQQALQQTPERIAALLEEKHRAMLGDLHSALAATGERMSSSQLLSSESVRSMVSQELQQTRESIQILQLAQGRELGANRDILAQRLSELGSAMQARQDAMRTEVVSRLHETLAEQGRMQSESAQAQVRLLSEQLVGTVAALSKSVETRLAEMAEQGRMQTEMAQVHLRTLSEQLVGTVGALAQSVDGRLAEIGGKVGERLEEGFKRTNETFASVMARLATIDEAQRKIDGLTSNVVGLQELLGDKRARGAFGEVQLEAIVRNALPPGAYEMQATLGNRLRVDCLLQLPDPTGRVAVDSKFPLENYRAAYADGAAEGDRQGALRRFKADVRKHIDDIAEKYIVPGETSDGAVMFVPAEAVFAEIHAHHPELVEHAQRRHVWITSPTTMMAILNTARAVIKDHETRRQVHVIKDALSKLARDFERFDSRMQALANHIRQANDDIQQVHVSSQKITSRFRDIEQVDFDHGPGTVPLPPPAEGGPAPGAGS
jgi:DNA recombination protein RmuC